MQPFYRFAGTGGNPSGPPPAGVAAAPQRSPARRRYRNHAAITTQLLSCSWFIGPIRSYDLPLESSGISLAFMTPSLAAACLTLLAAVLNFVCFKQKKTAERKTIHVKNSV
jgi:hypothetical protein